MPVITLHYSRLQPLLKKAVSKAEITETLPYLGLDLEETAEEYVRVEYNPNRPDFSSEWGVARALNGILGFESGAPRYTLSGSSVKIIVDPSVEGVRPFFVGAVVRGVKLDDELIRQIMAMQDDLDNGIGRMRRKVSTGIHTLDAVKPPFKYQTAPPDFTFTPLGQKEEMTLSQILEEVETGVKYGHIVKPHPAYPVITDSQGGVLSFPPIINGELTRVTPETENLFIDITSTSLKAAEDVAAVLLAALHDAGGSIETVEVHYPSSKKTTPDLEPYAMIVETSLVRRLLGLDLNTGEIVSYLERSRITAKANGEAVEALIPRYRSDILHPVDLVEEVALGYNIARLTPTYPETADVGRFDDNLESMRVVRDVLVGLGLMEVMNFSLVSRDILLKAKPPDQGRSPRVGNPKSIEHEYLRDSLVPTLLTTLSKNIHEEYPQRIFEAGKVFFTSKDRPSEVEEEYRAAAAIAHAEANYTEAKSHLTSLLSQAFGIGCTTNPTEDPRFIRGRAAEVMAEGASVGSIGEIDPEVLEAFGLRVPVSAFELRLEELLRLKR